jgi:hypothetical protein
MIKMVPNTTASLRTTLAAEVYLAEGQILVEEKILNVENPPIHRAGTHMPTVFKIGQNLKPR